MNLYSVKKSLTSINCLTAFLLGEKKPYFLMSQFAQEPAIARIGINFLLSNGEETI